MTLPFRGCSSDKEKPVTNGLFFLPYKHSQVED